MGNGKKKPRVIEIPEPKPIVQNGNNSYPSRVNEKQNGDKVEVEIGNLRKEVFTELIEIEKSFPTKTPNASSTIICGVANVLLSIAIGFLTSDWEAIFKVENITGFVLVLAFFAAAIIGYVTGIACYLVGCAKKKIKKNQLTKCIDTLLMDNKTWGEKK